VIRFLKIFFVSFLVIVLSIILLLEAGSVIINAIPDNGKYFSPFVSKLLKKPVTVDHVDLYPLSLYPEIVAKNIGFNTESEILSSIRLAELTIDLDLVQSIKQRQWITKKIVISNMKIHLQKSEKKKMSSAIPLLKNQPILSQSSVGHDYSQLLL